MRLGSRSVLAVLTFAGLGLSGATWLGDGGSSASPDTVAGVPVAFEPAAAADARARFIARGTGATLALGDRRLTFALAGAESRSRARVALDLPGARPGLRARPGRRLPGVVNDFRGRDRSRWRVAVPTYDRVRYDRVWPGVDLVVHSDRGALEYDFVVAPGADPRTARLRIGGDGRPRIDRDGALVVRTPAGRLTQRRPHIFQEVDGKEVRVPGRFVLDGREVSFAVGDHDRTRPLVIDPVILYSTFNGGAGADEGNAVAVAADGSPTIVGTTLSADFPRSFDPGVGYGAGFNVGANNSATDAFVTKLSADGTTRLFSTYFGGEGDDLGRAVAAMPDGSIAVGGETASLALPTTAGAPRTARSGARDGFVARFGSNGSLQSSTYYGGSQDDAVLAVASGPGNRLYFAGTTFSNNLPVTANVPQNTYAGGGDAFVAALSPTGTAIELTTYHGGSALDTGVAMAVTSEFAGAVVLLTGATQSANLPVANAAQPTRSGSQDAYVTRFRQQLFVGPENPPVWSRTWSTYHGGGGAELGQALALTSAGDVLVSGRTTSADLPLVDAFDPTLDGTQDLLVARFAGGSGARERSSYLGLAGADEPGGLAISPSSGRVWVGSTVTASGDADVVVHRLRDDVGALLDTTRVEATTGDHPDESQRGVATGPSGDAYLTGRTASAAFPQVGTRPQAGFGGGPSDAYLTRLSDDDPASAPPDTVITAGPDGAVPLGPVEFSFVAEPAGPGVSFECALDGATFEPCASPQRLEGLAAGDHTFAVRARGQGGAVDPTPATRSFTLAAPTRDPAPPAPQTPPTPPPAPGGGALSGPGTVAFGRSAVYSASFPGEVSDYAWDLDGSGRFATGTGALNRVTAVFDAPGRQVVRVRATGPGGTAVAERAVTVERPVLAQVIVTPARPRPGQKVTLKLVHKSEPSFRPLYFAWKVAGRKPRRRSLRIPARRVARAATAPDARAAATKPVTVRLTDAEPTSSATFRTTFRKSGVQRIEAAVIGGDGRETTVSVDVPVGRSGTKGLVFGGQPAGARKPTRLDAVTACTSGLVECGQIGLSPEPPGVGEPVTITNLTPSSQYCWTITTLGAGKGVQVGTPSALQRLDLGYPAPESFFAAGSYPGGTGAALAQTTVKNVAKASARSAQATQKEKKEVCVTFRTQTLSWDLGDGTVIVPTEKQGAGPPSASVVDEVAKPQAVVSPVVKHTYGALKKHTITVVSRRFSINQAKLPPKSDPAYLKKLAELIPIGLSDADANTADLVAKGILIPYLVKTTKVIEPRDCRPTGITVGGGIPVRAFTMAPGAAVDPLSPGAITGELCKDNDIDAWEPRAGQFLSLNGMVVKRAGAEDSAGVIVNRTARTLTAAGGGDLELTFHYRRGATPAQFPAGRTPMIFVKNAGNHPAVPGSTVSLPAYAGAQPPDVAGFRVVGGRVHLSASTSAYFAGAAQPKDVKNSEGTRLDEVITGEQTSPVLLGGIPHGNAGPRAVLRNGVVQPGDDAFLGGATPDFTLDLSGKSLGPLGVEKFVLAHYPADGWYGAGKFLLPMGATKYQLDALYRPDSGDVTNTSLKCAEAGKKGASGLYISDSEGFRFAGAQFSVSPGIVVGPVELGCFAARVTRNAKAFTIVGFLSGRFPPTGPKGKEAKQIAQLDVCALVAVLKKKGTTGGCAIQAQEFGVTVPGVGAPVEDDQVWVAVRGELDFMQQFKVNGGVDFRTGDNLLKISANAGITPRYYGPWRIGGAVFGRFNIKPEFSFAVGGEVELALLACPACVDVKALVSSKGLGACADTFLVSGGFRYVWGGSLSLFGGCGWEVFAPINVATSDGGLNGPDLRAVGSRVPAFGATASAEVDVKAADAKRPVSFELKGREGRAPRAVLTPPGGPAIVVPDKPGTSVFDAKGALVTDPRRFDPATQTRVTVMDALTPADLAQPGPVVPTVGPGGSHSTGRRAVPTPSSVEVPYEPTTIVTVPKPKAGRWTIGLQPGSVPMAGVRLRRQAPRQLRARARVVRVRGGGRRLEYRVPVLRGQRVRFVEEGRTLSRQIGVTKIGRGGTGSLPIPTERGSSGRRAIRAIVEQDGLPVEEFTVAQYVQPRPPSAPRPEGLRVLLTSQGRVQACWKRPARDVSEHEIVARGDDGTVAVSRTTGRCAQFPQFDEDVAVRVSVRAERGYGAPSAPALARRQVAARPVVLGR